MLRSRSRLVVHVGHLSVVLAVLPLGTASSQTPKGQGAKEPAIRAADVRLAWKLPRSGFVEYDRMRLRYRMPGAGGGRFGRGAMTVRAPAAGFYVHEISKRGAIQWPSSTIAGVIAQLGLSLAGGKPRTGQKQRVKRDVTGVRTVGTLRVRGLVETTDAQRPERVRQRGELELVRVEGKAAPQPRMGRGARDGRGASTLAEGKLVFTRVVDCVRGLVVSLDAKLTGSLESSASGARSILVEEEWDFVAVREPRYSGFQAEVDEAIAAGTRWLARRSQGWFDSGLFSDQNERANRSYGTGRLALVLLTLLKGNPDKDSAAIQDLVGTLRLRRPFDTYALACSIMALEALYAPANEAQQLREGLIERPSPRQPSAGDLALIERWAKRILANHDSRVDPTYQARFRYVGGPSYDNSNTQYAVLGLYSAALCGAKISKGIWNGVASHFVADQCKKEGKGTKLALVTYRQLAKRELRSREGKPHTVSRSQRVPARGWEYISAKSRAAPTGRRGRFGGGARAPTPTGSMTCAGITGLGVARAMLTMTRRSLPRKLIAKVDAALGSGFAWMHDNYDVRYNPRRGDSHYYYFLYGLERACEISAIARIDERDWYFDGAMQLLRTQQASGSWGSLDDTCFAILFLKRAVAPVYTGR